MKLAISSIAWRPHETTAIVEIMKSHEVSGIEVAPTLLFSTPVKAGEEEVTGVREYWNCNGIDVVAMQALLFGRDDLMLFREPSLRQALASYLEKIIVLASRLGVGPLVFGSPRNRDTGNLSNAEALDIAVEFFRKMGRVAECNGVVLCIEPLSPRYNCNFITNTSEAVELVQAVDHPGFGLHMDAGVLTMNGESYARALELAFPLMRHFHISEPMLKKITNAETNHETLAFILRDLCYEGWISIEMRQGQGDSNREVVDQCLGYVREIYFR